MERSQQSSRVEEEPQHDDSEVEVKQDLKCSACECQVCIPKGGVSDLPQNLVLGFEAKVAQYQLKIARAHEVPCDACISGSSAPSVGFCCQCLQFLCQSCCEHHRRDRGMNCHTVVSLGTEVTTEQLFPRKRLAPSCSFHGRKKLKL